MPQSRIPAFWAGTLAITMGTLFLFSAGSFVSALRHPATVVDGNYYSHGLGYGRDGREAPWRLAATVTADAVQISVVDTAGAPVSGGNLVCRTAGEKAGQFTFTEATPGVYATARRLLPKGDLRATVRFSKGGSHSTRRMVIFQ